MREKYLQTRVFLILALLLFTTTIFSQDSNFHIYLCFGQSNMEGQGKIEEKDLIGNERLQVMQAVDCTNLNREKGLWNIAIPPMTRCYNGLSPADYFGRKMVNNLPDSIRVGIINVSVGGCKIELFDKEKYQEYLSTVTEDWFKNIINEYDGNPYKHLIDLAKLAQNDGVIKGILLHQGESNFGDTQWPSKVKTVYDNLMSDLELHPDSVPLLAGEVVHEDQGGNLAAMNSIIAKLPQSISNSYVISSSGCTDVEDNIHFDSEGYRKLGIRYAEKMLSLKGFESNEPAEFLPETIYLEPECSQVGENWDKIIDTLSSNNTFVSPKPGFQSLSGAAEGIEDVLVFSFTVKTEGNFNIFARLNNATSSTDSYWVKIDNNKFIRINRLVTNGWEWKKLKNYQLISGEHTFTVSYFENGTKLDKLCITLSDDVPTNMGKEAENICVPENTTVDVSELNSSKDFELEQNYPNPFSGKTSISFTIPKQSYVSLKVFDMTGMEIIELAGKEYNSGKHTIEFVSNKLSKGNYVYTLKTDKFYTTRKMILLTEQ